MMSFCKEIENSKEALQMYVNLFSIDLSFILEEKSPYHYLNSESNDTYSFAYENKRIILEEIQLLLNECSAFDIYSFLTCYILQMIWRVNNTYEIRKTADEIKGMLQEKVNDGSNHYKDRTIYYRGQNNSNFNLIPSFYRSLQKDQYVNNKYVESQYLRGKSTLADRYKALFDTLPFNNNFYAYMQHAVSYSPLLDFSKSLSIAAIFALENNNYPGVLNNDRAIFELNLLNPNIERNPSKIKFEVQYVKGKIKPCSILFHKHIWELKSEDFKPQFCLIDEMTNDRMKVQKGLFLCLKKGVIVADRILIHTNDFWLTKYIISKNDIETIYNYIVTEHQEYKYDFLMNPYLFVNRMIEE